MPAWFKLLLDGAVYAAEKLRLKKKRSAPGPDVPRFDEDKKS